MNEQLSPEDAGFFTPFDELLQLLDRALEFSEQGELFLINQAHPALLARLVRALLPNFPNLKVVADPSDVFNAPEASVLIYVPQPEHAPTLNMYRPRLSAQQLKVILFSDDSTTQALRRNAPDFFDWISHSTIAPPSIPNFVERGLLLADMLLSQRIAWTGPDPSALFSTIFRTQRIEVRDTAMPLRMLCDMLEETRDRLLVCRDIIDKDRLARLREAMSKTGRQSSIVLWNPGPGLEAEEFWPVKSETLSAAQGIAALNGPRITQPGKLYALLEGEAEAIHALNVLTASRKVSENQALRALSKPIDLRSIHNQGIESLIPADLEPDVNSPLQVRAKAERIQSRGTLRKTARIETSAPAAQASSDPVIDYLQRYRTTLSMKFERFEMVGIGVVQPGGVASPVGAKLDEMYIPLRLDPGLGAENVELGRELSAQDIIKDHTRLVLCGMAGAGKTTWIKYTFRKLLFTGKALPLHIELRHLARIWGQFEQQAKPCSIEDYLTHSLQELGVGLEGLTLEEVLRHPGLRPILLIDGWDELGELGEQFREKLMSFLSKYPRINAVATSRPYGQSRPAHVEEFETLQFQPLSDQEIGLLSERFYGRIYGGDKEEAQKGRMRFMEALSASSSAQALARTPLLLLMMLLISRDRPLPDKRHRLYQACIENLLTARPDLRSREGARLHYAQWRPEDGAERLRAAAELAFGMQSRGYGAKGEQQAIVIPWEEAQQLLPQDWKPEQRQGFLHWLVGAAGVLSDRTDGSLSFVHLSFQEFLCAHHWWSTVEGEEARTKLYYMHTCYLFWWETLRLWAALVHDTHPKHLRPVLESALQAPMAAFWLMGAMLADGTGDEGIFQAWIEKLQTRFHLGESYWSLDTAYAWRKCKQIQRRDRLQNVWLELQAGWSYIQCLEAQVWAEDAGLRVRVDDAFERLSQEAGEGQGMGRGRVLSGFHALWPCDPLAPVFLRLWPTPRREISTRLTSLWLGSAGLMQEQDLTPRLLQLSPADPKRTQRLPFQSTPDLARESARHTAHMIAMLFPMDMVYVWASDRMRFFAFTQPSQWIFDAIAMDLVFSLHRPTTCEALAHLSPELLSSPLLLLFHQACRLSLNPTSSPIPFEQALAQYLRQPNPEPLWPALARWITRRPLPGDRELLLSLAQNPELRQHDSALFYGLKYYVRGDLVLPDNSEQSLDFYCDKLNVPRLPLLEEMPPELELEKS